MSRVHFATLFGVVTAATFCAPVRGQFQEPTKEELQLTVDGNAPGANAVYLYYADDQDETNYTRTYYERVKILTEKGKEHATLHFTHDPDTKFEVEGRTIHGDGTIVPLTEMPADLVAFKTKDRQVNSLVFTLPSADVGSILEYRVKFKYSRLSPFPTWFIQQDMFMHKAHYAFNPGQLGLWGVSYGSRLGENAKVADNKGIITLDVNDVASLPDDDWMPPLNTFKWRVWFFSTQFKSSQEYWETSAKIWADYVRDFTNPTGSLKKAVAEMVASGDSETVKAQKIYEEVMKLENTDFTREKTKRERRNEKLKDIHNAQDVWRDQSGNGDEIALLYVALCRSAGLNVGAMEVVDRSRALFDENLMNSGQLDDYIVVAQLDGKQVFLDPGEEMCPFGILHWKHTLARGLRTNDKTASIDTTPSLSFKSSNVVRIADLTIDPLGAVDGTVRLVMQGQEALYWRQIALENDEAEVKKRFNEWVSGALPEGVHGDFGIFQALADYKSNLTATIHVSGNLGSVTGKRIFLPGMFFEARSQHPFVTQDKRTIPVDVHYAKSEQDDVTYRLPLGYSKDIDTKPKTIYWPDHAKLTITTASETGDVHVVRTLMYNYTILDPKEYGSLHDFYQKVAAADQQQITLTKIGASTGGN